MSQLPCDVVTSSSLARCLIVAALLRAGCTRSPPSPPLTGTVTDPSGGVLPGVVDHGHQRRDRRRPDGVDDARRRVPAAEPRRRRYTCVLVRARRLRRRHARGRAAGAPDRPRRRADAGRRRRRARRGDRRDAGHRDRARRRSTARMSGDDIAKLALNFRATNNTSPIVVATLAQGVQQDRGGDISVAGALPFMTSFSVDGISTQRVRYGGPSRELFPSVESIEEFKVATASNSAEFMQVTDLTTTTRSGTNQFHGTAFWFNQDSALSADVALHAARRRRRSRSSRRSAPTASASSGGGPIVRNRAFFFGTYEGVRRPNEVTLSQIVPPDAWRAGDLSSVASADSQSVHGAAVRRQSDSGESGLRAGCSIVLCAAEPVHRRRDQRAELRRQRARRLHGQRLRRPRRLRALAQRRRCSGA